MKLSFDEMVLKINEKSGISQEDILARIRKKSEDLAGLVSKEGAAHIVANELGVDLFQGLESACLIKDIIAGARSVDVVGKVQALYEVREFQSQRGSGTVGSFLLADKTGVIRVTCWNAKADELKKIKVEDVVLIKNTYARENNGRLEVHLNDRSSLVVNPEGVIVEAPLAQHGSDLAAQPSLTVRKQIAQITANDQFVEVLGTIVQVFDPYFFEVCPQCNKRVRPRQESFACDAHGVVIPSYSCVLNAVLDDGSENIRAVFFREQAALVLGKALEELIVLRTSREALDAVKQDFLGKIVKISGKVSQNQMFNRLEIVARSVVNNPDPDEELRLLEVKKQSSAMTASPIEK